MSTRYLIASASRISTPRGPTLPTGKCRDRPACPRLGAQTQPDQLVIAEGRILALANNGTDNYVRVHSLETGNPIPLKIASPQGDQEVDRVLTAGKNWNVSLRQLSVPTCT